MATNYDIAKRNYDRGLWTKDMLAKLVARNKLTREDYYNITQENYED